MSQNALGSHGTLVARFVSGSYVTIGELLNITPPPKMRNEFDMTAQQDNDDFYVMGVRRKGPMTFQINFIPDDASHNELTGLHKAWNDNSRDAYRVTYPDASGEIFSGYIANIGPSAPMEGGLVADVTIRPTGPSLFF